MTRRSMVLLIFVFLLILCCSAQEYKEFELEKKDLSYYMFSGFFGTSLASMISGGSSG